MGAQAEFKHIREEILFEVLVRSSVKSLMKFRCVCKSWNALICSPSFINTHHERDVMRSGCEYLLINNTDTKNTKLCSVFCSETFAKCSDLEFPTDQADSHVAAYGSCKGLILCISETNNNNSIYLWNTSIRKCIYLWNPSIRKLKRLPVSSFCKMQYGLTEHEVTLGFGFDCEENDYKVVRIFVGVEVYSLRLNSWRRIDSIPPLHSGIGLQTECAYLNGVVYWYANENGTSVSSDFILAFHMSSKVFQKIKLPDAFLEERTLSIRVFDKSLAMFSQYSDYCHIWVLEMDSWKMIHAFLLPDEPSISWPLAFTTNGGGHILTLEEDEGHENLVLYDTKLKPGMNTGFQLSFGNRSYIDEFRDSLILLN